MNSLALVFGILFSLLVWAIALTRLFQDVKGATKRDLPSEEASPKTDASLPEGSMHTGFDEQLIKALQETALAYFYINLTKDRIIGGVMQEYADGSVVNVLESVGLKDNCPMSAFVAAWRDFTAEDSLSDYDTFFDLQRNIALFEDGAYSVSLTYKTVNAKREETWARQTMLLTQDDESDDVIAYCYANDVTIDMQRAGLTEPAEKGVVVCFRKDLQAGEESPLIKVLKETALIYFYINLSENRIVGSIIQTFEDGGSVDVLKNLGLEDNCKYSAFVEAWRAFVDEQFLSAYDDFFNAKNLIANFRAGIKENSLIYKTFNARGEDLWAKQTMLLSREEGTGDVLAFVYAHDVTIEMERKQ